MATDLQKQLHKAILIKSREALTLVKMQKQMEELEIAIAQQVHNVEFAQDHIDVIRDEMNRANGWNLTKI